MARKTFKGPDMKAAIEQIAALIESAAGARPEILDMPHGQWWNTYATVECAHGDVRLSATVGATEARYSLGFEPERNPWPKQGFYKARCRVVEFGPDDCTPTKGKTAQQNTLVAFVAAFGADLQTLGVMTVAPIRPYFALKCEDNFNRPGEIFFAFFGPLMQDLGRESLTPDQMRDKMGDNIKLLTAAQYHATLAFNQSLPAA